MPTHNNTTLGHGKLYIEIDGQRIELEEVTACEITMEPQEHELVPQTVIVSRESPTFTCSLHLQRKSRKRFVKLCMSRCFRRNEAQVLAELARKNKIPYTIALLILGI